MNKTDLLKSWKKSSEEEQRKRDTIAKEKDGDFSRYTLKDVSDWLIHAMARALPVTPLASQARKYLTNAAKETFE